MATDTEAFGAPGITPRWTHGSKSGVGTSYSASSKIWFTIFGGIVTEVYYPTVDRPQLRDLQYLITDGSTFFHTEERDLRTRIERLSAHALGYRCTSADPAGRYTITKTIITDPYQPCLLQRTQLAAADPKFLSTLKLFALCAPHLEVGGADNAGYTVVANGRKILMAHKGGTWLAMVASVPFSRVSCGYVGQSDGWTGPSAFRSRSIRAST
jgi:glucoamylase